MKLLADEVPDCTTPSIRAFFGTRFGDDTLDVAQIEREVEMVTVGPWKFTDPFDEPE